MNINFPGQLLLLILGKIFMPTKYGTRVEDHGHYTIYVDRIQAMPAQYRACAIHQADGSEHDSTTGSTYLEAHKLLVEKLPPIMLNEDGQYIESY